MWFSGEREKALFIMYRNRVYIKRGKSADSEGVQVSAQRKNGECKMRKRVKKSLSFLMALAMIVSVFCGSGMFVDAEDSADTAIAAETEGGESLVDPEETGDIPEEEVSETIQGDIVQGDESVGDAGMSNDGESDGVEVNDAETKDILTYSVMSASVIEEKSLTHEKYVSLNDDGTYDLNLTVSGIVGSETNKVPIDVVLIVDKSGSMARGMDSNSNVNRPNRRIDKVADATKNLTDSITANASNLDVRYNVVEFSSMSNTKSNGWTTGDTSANGTRAYNTVANISPNGGTNYQAGIRKAIEQLTADGSRSNAQKIVIFLTDGLPTYRIGTNWWGGEAEEGSGNSDSDGKNIDAAVVEAGKLNCNAFYCIGAGPDFNNSNSTAVNNLNRLSNAVNAETKAVYQATDVSSLENAFEEIAANTTTFLCDHVKISDTLSENAQMVMKDGAPEKLVVSVKDAEGNIIYGPSESISLPATDKNAEAVLRATYADKKIELQFPEEYQLESGWTYVVTATIDATEKAYENYRTNGNTYPDTGDEGTGETSAGKTGLYSNDEAIVTYQYKGDSFSENYPKPVIQLHPGTLIIEKEINGLEKDDISLDALKSNLKFLVKLSGETKEVSFNEFSRDNTTGKYTWRYEGIFPNTAYEISENNAEIADYDLAVSATYDKGTILKDSTATATFVNTYQPSNRTLTINKQVDGNMGDTAKEFSFTLALKKNDKTYTDSLKFNKNGTEGTLNVKEGESIYQFKLKHGDSIALEIPYGCEYTIIEDKQDYRVEINNQSSKDAKTTGTLLENTEITYKNIKDITTPTGLIHTMTPFFIMFISALGAIVFLLLRRRKSIC